MPLQNRCRCDKVIKSVITIDEMYDRGYKFFDLPGETFDYTLALICKNGSESDIVERACDVVQNIFEA
jgi:hypothetical protein